MRHFRKEWSHPQRSGGPAEALSRRALEEAGTAAAGRTTWYAGRRLESVNVLDKAASPSGPSAQEVEAMRKQITELTEKTTVKEDQLSRLRDSYSCVLQERDKAKDTADSLTKQLAKLRAEKRDDAPKKRCK